MSDRPLSAAVSHSKAERRQVSRLMLFFALAYVVEGACQAKIGVVWQPLVHFLKESEGWSPLQVSAHLAVLDIPWVIKPLYGLISDFVPVLGYRRRTYLLGTNLAAMAAYFWAGSIAAPGVLIAVLVVTSVALAAASTICGALLVENGHRHDATAAFVRQQWLWFNVAVVIASLLGGALVEWLPARAALRAAALLAASMPALALFGLTLVDEEPAPLDLAALRHALSGVIAAFRSRTLWLIAGFLFLYYFSPGFGTPLYYAMTDRLHFSQGFIGLLSSISAAGWIGGALLHRYLLRGLSTRALLNVSIALGTVGTLAFLGMVNEASAVAVNLFAGIAAMVANIATLTLAAEHCPEGAEGFTFAALMSVINLAGPVSDTLGSLLYERVFAEQLPPLIVVSAAATALIFALVPLLRLRPA
ncbi:MAG TPA: MFS transporter [Acetobacteraceae bacterium]|nr:MFS transporter [Acetobacteraceae bacterium]